MICRYGFKAIRPSRVVLAASLGLAAASGLIAFDATRRDVLAIASPHTKMRRPFHFGSQGPGDVFSNHADHTNRLIPVYTFGRRVDLGAVIGRNSAYRDAERIRALYGRVPEHTLNPEATYADQSDLHRVQEEAVARGAKYLFTIWLDGLDWETTRAAALYKTGNVYGEGKGTGLVFQDYGADGSAQFGFVVTSPTHDRSEPNVDAQTVTISPHALPGGYDARIAGSDPWTPGPLGATAPGYLKGQSADESDTRGVRAAGRVLHAYTDSSCSAAEYASGVKSYNNGVNVAEDGRFVPTLFERLQRRGWRVGTVTNVPFDHASPAAMYAHNVHREDYQDITREMLGLPGIVQETDRSSLMPGLDVVIGTGWGAVASESELKVQGRNWKSGNPYIAADDLAAIDVRNGGRYVVSQRSPGVAGAEALRAAAVRAASGGHRLFGLYGVISGHLPFRTADGGYNPSRGIRGMAERYRSSDLYENPTLVDMTRAALSVLSSDPGRPFALFVEAGDVDLALHDNNLDNALGAIYDGEEAVRAIFDWVERYSDWDESVVIVTADHGHYLVIDDPAALAMASGRRRRSAGSRPSSTRFSGPARTSHRRHGHSHAPDLQSIHGLAGDHRWRTVGVDDLPCRIAGSEMRSWPPMWSSR